VANGDAHKTGSLTLKVDGVVIGTINVPGTGGWQTWTTIAIPGTTSLTAGNHTVQVACNSRNGGGNLSWVSLTLGNSAKVPADVLAAGPGSFSIYPNPVSRRLFIPKLSAGAVVTITDVSGKIIAVRKMTEAADHIDLGFLKAGTYFATIREAGKARVEKFVKD
jgi:hypothetical protein